MKKLTGGQAGYGGFKSTDVCEEYVIGRILGEGYSFYIFSL